MDKLSLRDWTQTFSRAEHTVVHSSGRYTEVITAASEPGLVQTKSWLLRVPGMVGSFHTIVPERDFLLYDSEDSDYIQSAFILSGQADSVFNNRPVLTQANAHAFQYSSGLQETHRIRSKSLEAFHIRFEPDYFSGLIQATECRQLATLRRTLERKEQFLIPPSLLPLQARMNEIIASIRDCAFGPAARLMFIEGKMLELFALQLEQISRMGEQEKATLSKMDKEKLMAVKEYIEANFLQPLSLSQLGLMFGLNEFKLKKGFKHLFGTTVFGHIGSLRMQKAKRLLSQKELTVSEVADMVGYANVSSFSSEFKKRFGHSPSKAW